MRDASAYPFPIQYDVVEGVDIDRLVFQEDKSIAAECSNFAFFQKEVAAEVSVPVFMSSLLQVPMAQRLVGRTKRVGTVCGAIETRMLWIHRNGPNRNRPNAFNE